MSGIFAFTTMFTDDYYKQRSILCQRNYSSLVERVLRLLNRKAPNSGIFGSPCFNIEELVVVGKQLFSNQEE
jgi:hypothetical protein